MKRWPGLAVLVVVALALPAGLDAAADTAPGDCGLTTLDGRIDFSVMEDGLALKCGPGERLVTREDLADAGKARARTRTPLLSFVTIADVQLADEESPLRAEFMDKCETHPAKAAFRPHETAVPHLLNSHIRAANEIIATGSPVLGDDMDFGIGLGDLADNNQYNELRLIIDLFDGNKLVDPDSGADGYEGIQSTDPEGAPDVDKPLTSPVEGMRFVELANEPFWATGLHENSKPFPWYSLPGNHDVKVQGTAPNEPGFREWAEAWVVGPVKVTDGDPDQQQDGCTGGYGDPAWYQNTFTNPSGSKIIEPDPDRRLLSRQEWVDEHFTTTGVPVGHGYKGNRCTDAEGEPLYRACYSFVRGKFHFIGIDSNPDEGLEEGNIDLAQWKWLKHELRKSSKFNFKPKGGKRRRPTATNRLIVVFSHHPTESMHNTQGSPAGTKTAEQLIRLLLRFPNVILHSAGHTHKNKIWARENKELGTGYWEVNTAAIADFPMQSRTIEIADNRDGTLSIFAVVFDADVAPDPRTIDWTADDPTSEKLLGKAKVNINEDWLASAGQEIGVYDPQQDLMEIGTPEDRNVELLLRAPPWLR